MFFKSAISRHGKARVNSTLFIWLNEIVVTLCIAMDVPNMFLIIYYAVYQYHTRIKIENAANKKPSKMK